MLPSDEKKAAYRAILEYLDSVELYLDSELSSLLEEITSDMDRLWIPSVRTSTLIWWKMVRPSPLTLNTKNPTPFKKHRLPGLSADCVSFRMKAAILRFLSIIWSGSALSIGLILPG